MPRLYVFTLATIVAALAVLAKCGPSVAQAAGEASLLRPFSDGDRRSASRFGRQTAPRAGRFERRAYGHSPGFGAGGSGFVSSGSGRTSVASAAKPTRAEAAAAKPPPMAQVRASPQLNRRGARDNTMRPASVLSAGVAPPHRRPRPEEDPFAPLGIGMGGILLRPAIEVMGGHDSNPQRMRRAEASTVMIVAPELLARSNWSRHALAADFRGTYTKYFQDFVPELSRPLFDSKIAGRIDVSAESRIDLEGRHLLATDNPGSPNIQAGLARLPFFTRTGATLGGAHRFNRFEIAARGAVDRTSFEDSTLTDGSRASNDDRNFDQYGGALRGGYEMTPGVRPFVEAGADMRKHQIAVDRTGTRRDSVGNTLRVGTTFEFSHKLVGEISGGYLTRDYDEPTLQSLRGVIFDASLIWRANALTTVSLAAKSTADEVIVAGVSGVLRRDFALQVDHAFRRWLIGTAKLAYGSDDYIGSLRKDERYALSAGLAYKLTRTAQIKGELRHDWLRSSIPTADYTATAVLVGFRLQR